MIGKKQKREEPASIARSTNRGLSNAHLCRTDNAEPHADMIYGQRPEHALARSGSRKAIIPGLAPIVVLFLTQIRKVAKFRFVKNKR